MAINRISIAYTYYCIKYRTLKKLIFYATTYVIIHTEDDQHLTFISVLYIVVSSYIIRFLLF